MQLAGLGTTVVFALAALVWIAYLVPVWVRRREYLATERNAVRLQQTLRIMAETAQAPPEVEIAATAREIARQQRVLAKEARLQQAIARAEAVAKARELDEQIKRVEREVRAAVAGSVSRRQRLRRTRLACTLMLVASIAVGVAGALLPQATLLLAFAGVVATLAVGGLVAVNRTNATIRDVAQTMEHEPLVDERRAAASLESELASRAWTPVPVPAQRPGRAPIDVLRDHARRIVAEGEGATITPIGASFEQLVTGEVEVEERTGSVVAASTTAEPERLAAAAAEPAHVPVPAPPSRFAAMGRVDDDEAGFDVAAAFRRRVG
ncbi:hypothetical protein [Agrococcus sp. SGAir0287]|uniref:hypothetical protein n=1 Tax=Agrococcus sp. SGAir0287 TaxID=2070347 RepID=UPI0010CCDEEC|nr:hypothetical protein [Agrococcus sp. SGAir0287]QCR19873.1 hypothetical protein C1N71_10895 [Agrococcus sp. SGAir0287]